MVARRLRYGLYGALLSAGLHFSPIVVAATNGSSGGVDDFGMEDHSQICDPNANIQTLSVPDFDGDGVVDGADVRRVYRAVVGERDDEHERHTRPALSAEQYIAYYDINNDGALNFTDIMLTIRNKGKSSTVLDQQIAALFNAAIKYVDINEALEDGYIPFTQEYQNHGVHLIKFLPGDANVLDEHFDPSQPEGLNYDRYGNLVGIFYYYGPDVAYLMQLADPNLPADQRAEIQAYFQKWLTGQGEAGIKPAGFSPDGNGFNQDHWHFHEAVCSRNLMSPIPGRSDGKSVVELSGELIGRASSGDSVAFSEVFDVANQLDVRQCDLAQPCTQQGGVFLPRFYMLHMWLFTANNRCGIFWGTHENISVNDLTPEVDPASIPEERESFVIQPGGEFLLDENGMVQMDANGDPIANKNYRKMCLDPAVTAGMVYDNPSNPTLDPALPIGAKQYIEANSANDDVKQTLICPPAASGVTADEGCRRQLVKDGGMP